MSAPIKLLVNTPVLLAASVVFPMIQWMLPANADLVRALVTVICLLVMFGWIRWARQQDWFLRMTTFPRDREKRISDGLTFLGFDLLLMLWMAVAFPSLISKTAANIHNFLASPSSLSSTIAILVTSLVIVIFAVIPVMKRVKALKSDPAYSSAATGSRPKNTPPNARRF